MAIFILNYEANIATSEGFRAYAADNNVASAGLAVAYFWHREITFFLFRHAWSVAIFERAALPAHCGYGADEGRLSHPACWLAHGDRYSQAQWVGPERYC